MQLTRFQIRLFDALHSVFWLCVALSAVRLVVSDYLVWSLLGWTIVYFAGLAAVGSLFRSTIPVVVIGACLFFGAILGFTVIFSVSQFLP